MHQSVIATLLVAAGLSGCNDEGLSTAEAEAAAEAQVRQRFAAAADVPLKTQIFVGSERRGEPTLCGTVSAAGEQSPFPPQRFVSSTDPARWLVFENAHSAMQPSVPGKFAEWSTHCLGERGDNADEPLAPTAIGEES